MSSVRQCLRRTDDALLEAGQIQRAVAAVGFDWPDISGVVQKVREELNEIERARERQDSEEAKRELGDLLFAVVNLARFLDADPGAELHRTNVRFCDRFDKIEEWVHREGRSVQGYALAELDVFWERAKKESRED